MPKYRIISVNVEEDGLNRLDSIRSECHPIPTRSQAVTRIFQYILASPDTARAIMENGR